MQSTHRWSLGSAGYEPVGTQAWSRPRLIALLLWVALIVGVLGVGLALTVLHLLHPRPHPAHQATARPRPAVSAAAVPDLQGTRERLAAAPMPHTGGPHAARPSMLTTRQPGLLRLPAGSGTDTTGVRTGYPRTPQGALAQLAAIDQAAMQSGTLTGARTVITAWALPGGPTASTWSGVKGMAVLLSGAGAPADGLARLSITFTPAMGLIKGHVGDDFVVPCVDYVAEVSEQTTATAAVADCQQMAWTGTRWQIDAGPEPAVPQSVWPDTDAAISAGWKDLTDA